MPTPAAHARRSFVRRQIQRAWREPGTRLGMWVHFTTQFPGMVFLLLWGMPFLVEGQGLARSTAGELLTLVVLSNMAVGLVYGQVIARHHAARAPLALGTVAVTARRVGDGPALAGARRRCGCWCVLCSVLGACGPASMIGFDFARPANPPERQGTASGIVNIGGFTASMTTLLAVGVLLDAHRRQLPDRLRVRLRAGGAGRRSDPAAAPARAPPRVRARGGEPRGGGARPGVTAPRPPRALPTACASSAEARHAPGQPVTGGRARVTA